MQVNKIGHSYWEHEETGEETERDLFNSREPAARRRECGHMLKAISGRWAVRSRTWRSVPCLVANHAPSRV